MVDIRCFWYCFSLFIARSVAILPRAMYRKGQYARIFRHDIDLTIQTGRYLLPNCYFQHHYGDNHRHAAIHHDAECPVGLAQACKDLVLILFAYQVLQSLHGYLRLNEITTS